MNHAEVRSKMPDYLEGELDLTQRALLDAHLDACGDCRGEFAEMRGTIRLLRELPDPKPPPFLVENVMRRIRDGETRRSVLDRIGERLRQLLAPPVSIPAAALALGLLMATGVMDPATLQLPGFGEAAVADEGFARTPAAAAPPLAARSRPPAVAPAPRVRVTLPQGGESTVITQVAANESRPARRSPRSLRGAGSAGALSFPVSGGAPRPEPSAAAFRALPGTSSAVEQEAGRRLRGDAQLDNHLESMIHRPVFFAGDFASRGILEQEMWLRRLAAYARETGREQDALTAMTQAPDLTARQIALAFAAELRRLDREAGEGGPSPLQESGVASAVAEDDASR